jgi:hypothetical protein
MLILIAIIIAIVLINYQRFRSHKISLLNDDEQKRLSKIMKKQDSLVWLWVIFGLPLLLLMNITNVLMIIIYTTISVLPYVIYKK